jgi:hypothetical protein
MPTPQRVAGPSPSEEALIKLWDRIDRERARGGERAAHALAQKALAAVEPPKEGTAMPQQTKVIRGMKVEQRSASAKSAAEVLREAEESTKRANESIALADRLLEEMRSERTTTTSTTDPGDALIQRATAIQATEGIGFGEAAGKAAAENPGQAARHRARTLTGAGAGVELAGPAGRIQAAEAPPNSFEEMVLQYAEQHRVGVAEAWAKVASEQPKLYEQHRGRFG